MLAFFFFLFFFFAAVLGHMQLTFPAALGAANNPHRTDAPDPYLQYPFNCCGPNARWEYPCHGHLNLLGTPQGAPVASWPAGSRQQFSISGIGNHYGGSCQVGFSVDKGKTFQVAASYEGNCPHRNDGIDPAGQTFDFTVPADMPVGDVVFAWTWFNREQEFNMNCASVTITTEGKYANGGDIPPSDSEGDGLVQPIAASSVQPSDCSTTDGHGCTDDATLGLGAAAPPLRRKPVGHRHRHKKASKRATTPYAQRPGMLVADTDNGCLTPRTTAEVRFPHPGPDVVQGDGEYPLELPTPAEACGYC